ncbi:MAG: hypothetical protein D6689_00150 [Deltaproteobacteria bacterium]|nr:MAG: hypothetical protein D6689_00150 [Deltaproteobacteria bacterium]
MARHALVPIALLSVTACGTHGPSRPAAGPTVADAPPPAADVAPPIEPTPLQRALAAMEPARATPPGATQRRIARAVDDYFARLQTHRVVLSVDKPLYQPGETIWFRVWELATRDLSNAAADGIGTTVEFITPQGSTLIRKRVRSERGLTRNDFELPAGIPGGEYTLRARSDTGAFAERKLIVSSYQPPRVKKKLEFLRKAYGPGDAVTAALALHRATGEPLATTAITAIATVDGAEVARAPVATSADGKALVRFSLPREIARGDGLLTIVVDDGGVAESIQKRIPITLAKIQFALFPEGGDLVAGLPGRVYFQAKNLIGKPADVSGVVVDDRGAIVAEFASLHNGMGRFELTPKPGRTYTARIVKPAGIEQTFALPAARAAGCAMQSIDDFANERDDLRVAVWCTAPRTVIATAMVRERRLATQAVAVPAREPAVIALDVPRWEQGAVRVTLFDDAGDPLAERLVYRGRGQDMRVAIEPDRESYAPRDRVTLTVRTTGLDGKPVPADLAVAVVDDTVLSYADDKTGHLLAKLYLEPEMPGQTIEEPNFYFSDDPKAPAALDLVLGTQGWRRFAWEVVLRPQTETAAEGALAGGDDDAPRAMVLEQRKVRKAGRRGPVRRQRVVAERARPPAPPAEPAPARDHVARRNKDQRNARGLVDDKFDARAEADVDEDWIAGGGGLGAGRAAGDEMLMWAPVREFSAPNYDSSYDGPRVDFRETIYWAPSVRTGDDGTATVSFSLSDAVTSFRATAEGVSSAGIAGRGEALVQSKLPVSLVAKLPLEVSAGDRIELPVTVANETARPYTAEVVAEFGPAFRVTHALPGSVRLGPGERKSLFVALDVTGNGNDPADGRVRIAVRAAHLEDAIERTIDVVPVGFPQEHSFAGTLQTVARHEVDLRAVVPGTISAQLTLYPSPLATMTKGTEAILREPYGCFEQASSSNYPNIMVLSYLEEHDAADPDVVARAHRLLDKGYKLLTGYESPTRGYEWFGGDPGHEALTAYGLMEFADMKKVFPDVDDRMVARTRAWLRSRRDGKGGYLRNPRALDSFGRASEQVTNGYITWALTEAGERDLDAEVAYQRNVARTTTDPYLMALAANVLANVAPDAADTRAALDKLAGMAGEDGAFAGADHSITRSGGVALTIETTALAAMALMKGGPRYLPRVTKAIEWIDAHRSGYGGYGSTQSTVLALRALARYAAATRTPRAPGHVDVYVNGAKAGSIDWTAGERGALELRGLGRHLKPGHNTIELRMESTAPMPYSMVVAYRSEQPASSPDAKVAIHTKLDRATVPWGESVRMHVSMRNLTSEGLPMTLARVGIPGGLQFQTWQLKELVDKGQIDFFETRDREVVLYWRSMAPKAAAEIDLQLLAAVPGRFAAPASTAYLYYTDEHKHWAEPVSIEVQRAK